MEHVNCNICGLSYHRLLYTIDKYNVVKCRNCSLVYVNPRLTPSELETFYEGDYYEKYKSPSYLEMRKWERLVDNIRTYKKGGKLLDVGCSTGNLLNIAKDYFEVYGIEIARWSSKFAREQHNLDIFKGTLEERNFPDSTFDIFFASELIEHLHNPSLFIEEAKRILKKDGLLALTTGNSHSIMAKLRKEKWRYFAPKYHLYYFSPKTIKDLLLRQHFKILKFSGNMGLAVRNILSLFKHYHNKAIFFKDIGARIKIAGIYIGSSISVYAKRD